MPGMDVGAPERTETNSGASDDPSALPDWASSSRTPTSIACSNSLVQPCER